MATFVLLLRYYITAGTKIASFPADILNVIILLKTFAIQIKVPPNLIWI